MTKYVLCTGFALMGQISLWAGLPDLIINSNTINPLIVTQTFSSNDCSVLYGCAAAGTRTLLEFTTEVMNIGTADLVLGNPTNNPLFYYSTCDGRYYFEDCASYGLFDTNGNVVVASHKASFCIGDDFQWNPAAHSNQVYNCSYQGLQQGWVDDYESGLPCQWVDVTGVPAGHYMLQLTVNPLGLVQESNTNNNTIYVAVFVPGLCQTPANDNFANAQVLPAAIPQTLQANNYCATVEPSEPWIYNVRGGSSIWFSWTPSINQEVNLTTLGSDPDTLLAVYTGTAVTNMSQVTANNDIGPGTVQSGVIFSAEAGTNYLITVDGVNGAQGVIQLNFNDPPNDLFANCQEISGLSGQVCGYNIGATQEPGEPAHDGNAGGDSVWYCWTAPTNGVEIIDTIGSDFDTVMAVYTGNALNNLTRVAADDDSGGNKASRVSFQAQAGTTYHIAVDGYNTSGVSIASGKVELNWNPPCQLAVVSADPFRLSLTGGYGWYNLESSTDLQTWQVVSTFYVGQSVYYLQDSRSLPAAYYRAVLTPSP